MNNFTTYLKRLWLYGRSKQQYFLAALLCLILYSFSFIPLPAPGIDHPTAIAPYLNGAFPDSAPNGANGNWVVENAFPNLTFSDPLAFLEIPGGSSYYVVGKTGQIWQIANDPGTTVKKTVLDIGPMVDTDGDAGLLNAALHPEFGQAGSPNRGYIYVYYRYHPEGNVSDCETGAFLRLSRFTRPDGSEEFDPASELVMIQTYDEMCWHGGGAMFFDQEGYFYLATGDAGGINDDFKTTQKLNERFFGCLLRIDVDRDPSRSHPIRRQQVDPPYKTFADQGSYSQGYYIPNDNPWLDPEGSVLEEFYALGLRSPHRASIDPLTGKIWVGDVGQGLREEISIISKGANLQWPFREGFLPGDLPVPNPLIGVSTPPVYDYGHGMGNSIIGGFVYRGDYYQGALNGQYLFGDHGVRNVWAYNPVNGEVSFVVNIPEWGSGEKNGISSFALNSAGEIFILKLYGTDMDGGVVYRLKQGASVAEPPKLLSQTGAFADLTTLTPAPGLIPYDVNAPLWSDRAAKKRWIALPNDGSHNSPDEQISFSAAGNWQFPAGTVFIKHFDLPLDYRNPAVTRPLETRFLVITEDGGAYGVTYKWNDAGTDAELLVNGVSQDYPVTRPNGSQGVQTWSFPNRTDCMTCHNANADFVLGVHTWQLNGELTYPSGITDNQLNTWRHLGMFANPFSPEQIPGFLRSANIHDEAAPLGTRVRSYLDANCAHCHQPNGVEGAFDARFSTPLENQNILWTFGASRNTPEGHYVIKPKDISESEIWIRDSNLGGNAMPPLGKGLLDEDYLDVLMAWINSLEEEACAEQPVSELKWVSAVSRNGQIEINRSIGSEKPNDGRPITINGREFALGLGVHAYSEIVYKTRGDYAVFQSYAGVDDEILGCNDASVHFEVYADDQLVYRSPLIRGGQDALLIRADIAGADEVKLVVTGGEDGEACDHADWADPRFLPCADCTPGGACNDGNACTINDVYDADCHCAGAVQDSDGDGVCDAEDKCPGGNDTADADGDGLPDACDPCNEQAGAPCDDGNACTTGDKYDANCNCAGILQDSDGDGVCDAEDQCPGFNDLVDTDGDGLPDGCDACMELAGTACDDGNACTTGDVYNANCNCAGTLQDSDGDGVCDAEDQCPGFNDQLDIDGDGIPNGCDSCNGTAGTACDDGNPCTTGDVYNADCKCTGVFQDSDGDGVCDAKDQCPGFDDLKDLDADGLPDGCDDNISCQSIYLTDLDWTGTPLNSYGPLRKDRSADGNLLTINGRTFERGLGGHAYSEVVYQLDGAYHTFYAAIGVDDETDCSLGSVVFSVYTDGELAYASPLLWFGQDALPIQVDVAGANELKLVITRGNETDYCDHGNWAAARLEHCVALCTVGTACDDGDDCTVDDRYNADCDCAGTPADSDGDGVCDAEDQCPGFDDLQDVNANGLPDGCDECLIQAGQPCDDGDACTVDDRYDENCVCKGVPADEDGDGVCDAEDQCPGKDDRVDENNNGTPDGCEESNRIALMPLAPKLNIIRTSIFAEAIVRFKLEQEERISVLLLDPLGLIDTVLAEGLKPAGTQEIRLKLDRMPGLYQVQLHYPAGIIRESLEIGQVLTATGKPLQVKVYPNPFHNEFKLYISPPYPELKRAVIRIMDTNGRIIYQQYDAPFNEQITIRAHSGWVNGLYLMRIHASDYSFTYTIVKQ